MSNPVSSYMSSLVIVRRILVGSGITSETGCNYAVIKFLNYERAGAKG